MRTALAGFHLEGNGGSWNPGAGGDGWSGGGGGCGGDCGCGGKGGGGSCGGKPSSGCGDKPTGVCGEKPSDGGVGLGGGSGQLPLIPDYDGEIWGGSGRSTTFGTYSLPGTTAPQDSVAKLRGYCTVELICGELRNFFGNPNPPPPDYGPDWQPPGFPYFGVWHCELEVAGCDGKLMRYGVIGPGNETQPEPVMGSDGIAIGSKLGVKQRVPAAGERAPDGSHANPWLITIDKWEFACANWLGSEGKAGQVCDITPLIKLYPHLDEDWSVIGPNCNSFAMWIIQEMGLSAEFPPCPPMWMADANVWAGDMAQEIAEIAGDIWDTTLDIFTGPSSVWGLLMQGR